MLTQASPYIIYCLKNNLLTFKTLGACPVLLVFCSKPSILCWLENISNYVCSADVIFLQRGSALFIHITTIIINSQVSLQNVSGKKSLKCL